MLQTMGGNPKNFNKLDFKPKPRWPLDKDALFMKGKRIVGE